MLLLLACTDKPGNDAEDTAQETGGETSGESAVDSDSGEETDTAPPPDEDRDGYAADVDCEDNDYRIYPGAPETCDGRDEDCDGAVDEDFDVDGDAHTDPATCKTGDDCDDTNADAFPGATETPYDGVDQDCDGADLSDVDGDGWSGGRGPDCDDNDPSINPDATDVAFDGVDQDCDGTDSQDGDGDGYDAAAGDCDDADPTVHPGHIDFSGDGLDADCDEEDGGTLALADAPVIVSGTEGSQDLLGYDAAACDLDEDGFEDLIVAAPFADAYLGQIGIWYGANVATWTGGLATADADTLVTSTSQFLGFGVECADVDGDGHQDLVAGRGEIHYGSTYDTDFGLVVWYGDGAAWPASVDESAGAVELTLTLGVTRNVANVYAQSFWAVDLDGDDAAELVLHNSEDTGFTGGDSALHVVPGARYATNGNFVDQAGHVAIDADATNAIRFVGPGGDPDRDGAAELLLGQSFLPGTRDTADTADTGVTYDGQLLIADWGAADALADLDGARWTGASNTYFGWAADRGDFDGDGAEDLLVSGVGEGTGAAFGGGLYAYADYASVAAADLADAVGSAGGLRYGEFDSGYLGWAFATAGDVQGDGVDDVVVAEPNGAASGAGRVYVLDGLSLWGNGPASDGALLTWQGEDADASTGSILETADFDGDGRLDYLVTAYTLTTLDGTGTPQYTGRAYVILTSLWGA